MRRFLAGCILTLACIAAGLPASAQEIVAAGPKPRIFLAGKLIGANFNSTGDQAITITGTALFGIPYMAVTNCSASLTTAQGGFYQSASKTNSFFNEVATTPWTGLTTSTRFQTVGGGQVGGGLSSGSSYTFTGSTTIYLSLTTAQGTAATCDVYVFGEDLN